MKLNRRPTTVILASVLAALISILANRRLFAQQPSEDRSTAESREEYQKKAQAELDELDRQMKVLEAKARTEGAEAQREMRSEYRQFSRQHRAAARQLEQLRRASKETWEKAKPQVNAAMDELERAYQRFDSQLNKKG